MAGASCLAVECQPSRIEMRLKSRYLDVQAKTLDDALAIIEKANKEKKPKSVGVLGNAADIFPELVRRGVRPDIVTDQTSAHDPVNGYLPKGWTLVRVGSQARQRSAGRREGLAQSMSEHVRAMLDFHKMGVPTSTTATTSARWPRKKASTTRSTSRASCPPISARCSAAASARSAGRALRRSRGHLQDRRQGEGDPRTQQGAGELARHGARAHPVPGPAGAHLLGRPRRSPSPRPRLQRDGALRAS
jgi:hypothetical protein